MRNATKHVSVNLKQFTKRPVPDGPILGSAAADFYIHGLCTAD